MATTQVLEVTASGPTEHLWGANLEAPRPADRGDGRWLDFVGWVLGRTAPAVAIEVVSSGEVLTRIPISVQRPDVAAFYPQANVSDATGFQTLLYLPGTSERDLLIRAVLTDECRVPIATLKVRTEPDGAPSGESLVTSLTSSGLFDPQYYTAQTGIAADLVGCAEHYLRAGAAAGYSPSLLFDAAAYLVDHEDVARSGMPPFLHFVVRGMDEGRRTRLPEKTLNRIHSFSTDVLGERRILSQAVGRGWNAASPSAWAQRKVAVYASSLGNFFFRHIADRLTDALRADGVEVYRLDQNSERPMDVAADLFVAPHEFFHLGGGRAWGSRPEVGRAVMLNTEQPGSHWYFLALQYAGPDTMLVDMSPQSALVLKQLGRHRSGYLPLGVVPRRPTPMSRNAESQMLEQILRRPAVPSTSWRDRPIDVLFLGTLTARRSRALARLAPTLSRYRCFIHAPTGHGRPLTGGKHDIGRDESLLLARQSKILLNIHRDDLPYFEWHRVMMTGLEQGVVVLSEACLPSPGIDPGRHYLSAALDEFSAHIDRILQSSAGDEYSKDVDRLVTQELPVTFDLVAELRALSFLHEVAFRG